MILSEVKLSVHEENVDFFFFEKNEYKIKPHTYKLNAHSFFISRTFPKPKNFLRCLLISKYLKKERRKKEKW